MAKMRDKDNRTFKEATANMTGKEKIGHIWEYYKWIILGSIATSFFVFSIIHAFLVQVESYLTISIISGFEHTASLVTFDFDTEEDPAELSEEEFFPEPPVGIWVDFEITPILESLLLDEDQLNNYEITVHQLAINIETLPVFSTHTGAGVIDIIITYISDLHAMTEFGHLQSITDLEWDIPENKMHNEYAVYLRYFSVFDDYVAAPDDLVLVIPSSTRLIENVENFFNILLD